MTGQPTLFDATIDHGTARRSDPHSSRTAARNTRPAKAKADVLAALVSAGGTGTLDTVCERLPGRLRNAVSRRLTDLERDGRIRKTGEYLPGSYGQPVAVWETVA